jgi:hypothetical protein
VTNAHTAHLKFKPLTQEEFEKLSMQDKIDYLAAAVQHLGGQVFIAPAKKEKSPD